MGRVVIPAGDLLDDLLDGLLDDLLDDLMTPLSWYPGGYSIHYDRTGGKLSQLVRIYFAGSW